MDRSFSLDGRRVLVTGASSGFGAHFAEVLAHAGADLVLAARRTERLAKTAERVRELGRNALVLPMDVADFQSVAQAFADMPAIDCVVNNAGINRIGTTHELAETDWDAVMDTNTKGVWSVSRFAIEQWIKDERPGNIVNIASVLGIRVGNQLPVYTASKAAVVQLTRSIALDYARHGIRCNAICPGFFETDINRDFMQTPAGQKLIGRIPCRRMGELGELDGPLLLLVSGASSYMSGAVISVDGGHLCSPL